MREQHENECLVVRKIIDAAKENRVAGSTSMLLICGTLLENIKVLPEEETEDTRAIEGVPESNIEAFMRLQANIDKLEETDERDYRIDAAVLQECSVVARGYSIQRLVDFFSRVACNCFRIENENLDLLGLALYPGASFFNHSCAPNAVYIFDGKCMVFRALRPIKPGEEVLISYIRLVGGKHRRRERLHSHYYFDCSCEACTGESDFPDFEGILCRNPACAEKQTLLKFEHAKVEPDHSGDADTQGIVHDMKNLGITLICPNPIEYNPLEPFAQVECPECGNGTTYETLSNALKIARAELRKVKAAMIREAEATGDHHLRPEDDDEDYEYDEEDTMENTIHTSMHDGEDDDDNNNDNNRSNQEDSTNNDDNVDDGGGRDRVRMSHDASESEDQDDGGDDEDAGEAKGDGDDDDDGEEDEEDDDDQDNEVYWTIEAARDMMRSVGLTPRNYRWYLFADVVRSYYEAKSGRGHYGCIDAMRDVVSHLSATIPPHECELALEQEKLAWGLGCWLQYNRNLEHADEALANLRAALKSTEITYGVKHRACKRLRLRLADLEAMREKIKNNEE